MPRLHPDEPMPFETTNPKRDVLIAWLEEAARGGCTFKATRRLCFEAALMLKNDLTPPKEDATIG